MGMEKLTCCGYVVPDGFKDYAGHIFDNKTRSEKMSLLTAEKIEFQLVGGDKGNHILVEDKTDSGRGQNDGTKA